MFFGLKTSFSEAGAKIQFFSKGPASCALMCAEIQTGNQQTGLPPIRKSGWNQDF
jgi:hypothetical protein